MTFQEFQAGMREMSVSEAQASFDHIADLDLSNFDSVLVYADGCFILRQGDSFYMDIEAQEYSGDLTKLESILWDWRGGADIGAGL